MNFHSSLLLSSIALLTLCIPDILLSKSARLSSHVVDGCALFKYKLTTLNDFVSNVGKPWKSNEIKNGGIHLNILKYTDGVARFSRFNDLKQPYTLFSIDLFAKDKTVDIGISKPIVLTNTRQLEFFQGFDGYEGLDLSKLDLKNFSKQIVGVPFDSNTIWPKASFLPKGFNPKSELEIGKKPDSGPQMHGAALASFSVGKTCGVAPDAKLHYYSVPMWKKGNSWYIECIRSIVNRNKRLPEQQRVRAIAISTAMFSRHAEYDRYQSSFKRAWDSGLAALAYQVNSKLTPDDVIGLLVKTAKHAKFGRVVNPIAFISAVKSLKK